MKSLEQVNGLNSADDLVRNLIESGNNSDNQTESLSNTLGGIVQIIKDRRWGIIIMMFLGSIAGVFKAISETPIYEARLTMAVEPSTGSSTQSSLFDPYAFRFYETQYELLKSRSVAERVVDRLQLVERQSVQQLLVPPGVIQSLLNDFST